MFDVFFPGEERRALTLKTTVSNETDVPQRILFSVNGQAIEGDALLEPDSGPAELSIHLPEMTSARMTIEMDMPEAVLLNVVGETLAWNSYSSIAVHTAELDER